MKTPSGRKVIWAEEEEQTWVHKSSIRQFSTLFSTDNPTNQQKKPIEAPCQSLKSLIHSGHYILQATPKGSACTSLGAILKKDYIFKHKELLKKSRYPRNMHTNQYDILIHQ
jgi:hypothetical protein